MSAKRALNRRLAESRPGLQSAELIRACIRNGTRYRLVPAAGTSITCAVCGRKAAENRKTQAEFHCQECRHERNADVNAADGVRIQAEAYTRVGVSRPWAIELIAERAEAARRKAKRTRQAEAGRRRSRKPETRTSKPAGSRREAATTRPQREATQLMRESRSNLRSS